jgi:hypothetical protein
LSNRKQGRNVSIQHGKTEDESMELTNDSLNARVAELEKRVARLQWGFVFLMFLALALSGSLSLLGMSYSTHLMAERPGVKRVGD